MASPTPPTLIALPDELHGPRVLLRPYRAEDAAAAFAAVEESREHLRPWVPWAESNATVEETRDYCIRCAANWLLRSDLTLGIFGAGSGRYLGGTGLHEPDWELRSFEIGYWLRATATGQGYATEAVSLLVDLAFAHLDARRVEIRCDTRNDASRRVAERAGFVLEGTLRNAALASDGRPADWLVFSLVPDDLDR
jgi:RimJ/RimL family protein N-acetyltransferase